MKPPKLTRRPSGQSGESSSPSRRSQTHTQPWYASAYAYRVVGVRGRERLVLVVAACPFCRCAHMHSAVADFTTGKRTASCHGGRYVVQLRGEAA